MDEKTNVIRLLDSKKINYKSYFYGNGEPMSADEVSEALGKELHSVYKTLVTEGKTKEHYVFVVPAGCELDLKKAAKAVGEKSVEMIKSKELLPLTGYIHGGCSPIGMKKFFKTTVDISARDKDLILFSGGRIGCQVEMSPESLAKLIRFQYADIIKGL